jgi:hypothetical protein
VGCVRVGEVAKGEQLIANQGQKWMGIRTTSKKAGSPRKYKVGKINKGWRVKMSGQCGARNGVDSNCIPCVNAVICYV